MQEQPLLLSAAYFPPIQWFAHLQQTPVARIDAHEHFIRQTYRNRCLIASSHGVQVLTVPIEAPQGKALTKTPMKDVRVSYHDRWQHQHWHALVSAYGESAFFEYLQDDIRPLYEKHWIFLLDLCMASIETVCRLLDIEPELCLTTEFLSGESVTCMHDLRTVIRPKHPLADPHFAPKEYYQVFAPRTGFLPNLSVLDLIFNMGNEAEIYLNNIIKQ